MGYEKGDKTPTPSTFPLELCYPAPPHRLTELSLENKGEESQGSPFPFAALDPLLTLALYMLFAIARIATLVLGGESDQMDYFRLITSPNVFIYHL